jgi:hypothetical protein
MYIMVTFPRSNFHQTLETNYPFGQHNLTSDSERHNVLYSLFLPHIKSSKGEKCK